MPNRIDLKDISKQAYQHICYVIDTPMSDDLRRPSERNKLSSLFNDFLKTRLSSAMDQNVPFNHRISYLGDVITAGYGLAYIHGMNLNDYITLNVENNN